VWHFGGSGNLGGPKGSLSGRLLAKAPAVGERADRGVRTIDLADQVLIAIDETDATMVVAEKGVRAPRSLS
jgi:hypothetical protein